MRTSPSLIIDHLHKRGQTGDDKLTLDDLISLHEKHEEYVKTLKNVIVIDVTSLSDFEKTAEEMILKLKQRIYI